MYNFINLSSNEEEISSESEGDEINDTIENEVFDIRVTSTHKYLRANEFGDISGLRSFVEAESNLKIPIIVISAVLMPGQILPLYFESTRSINFVRSFSKEKTYYFGLITLKDKSYFETSKIGTLFQVTSFIFINKIV